MRLQYPIGPSDREVAAGGYIGSPAGNVYFVAISFPKPESQSDPKDLYNPKYGLFCYRVVDRWVACPRCFVTGLCRFEMDVKLGNDFVWSIEWEFDADKRLDRTCLTLLKLARSP